MAHIGINTVSIAFSTNMKFLVFSSAEGDIYSLQIAEDRRCRVHSGNQVQVNAHDTPYTGCIDTFKVTNNLNSRVKAMTFEQSNK